MTQAPTQRQMVPAVRGHVEQASEFGPASPAPAVAPGRMMEVAASRAAQEVRVAMVIAKEFRRDEAAAFQRIMQACHRRKLCLMSRI